MLGPKANISLNFKKSLFFSISTSKTSKDSPSPSARSAKPPKSARESNFTKPGTFTILKFSILSFELDFKLSMIDVKSNFPPEMPLKKLYSVNKGRGKSE